MCSCAPWITSPSVSPRITAPHSHAICLATAPPSVAVALVVRHRRWDYLGAGLARSKVQLCGKLVVELGGERIDGRLPGRQGRMLFAFLALNRSRRPAREELVA